MTSVIVFIAKYVYLICGALFVGYAALTKSRREFILLSVLVLPTSYLLSLLAGHLFYDPRPFVLSHIAPLIPHAPDNGFVSDHALLTGTLAAIVTVFSVPLGLLMWFIAFLIGAARVLAGIHHTIDIVGAFLIAVASTMAIRQLLRHFRPS